MNGSCPLSRTAINESGSDTFSMISARRNRSMCACSQGSRATRSSAMGGLQPAGRSRDTRPPVRPGFRTSRPRGLRPRRLRRRLSAPDLRRHAVTNSFSTAAPSANSDCATAASAAASTRTNAASGSEPASVHASSTTRRLRRGRRQKCRQKLTRGVGTAGLEFHLDERHEQRRIVPGGFTIEKAAGRLEVPC